jgi:hypothetical protein
MYIENKLIHYNLNLDYSLDFLTNEKQTNILINKIINNFINKYKEDFNKKIFVFEFNDDLISTIGYKILVAITAIKPEFNFILFGKIKKAKKQINYKKEKFISKRKLLKNKDNIIFISSFNPIYKVAKLNRSSIDFIIPDFYLMEQFTYSQILTSQIFYNIGYIKDHELDPRFNKIVDNFNNWINNPKENFPIKDYYCAAPQKITLIWIENDGHEEDNIKLMQDLEQSNNLIFYYFKQKTIPKILQDRNFLVLLKRTTNRPNKDFLNINTYEIPIKLAKEYNVELDFIGNWSERNKQYFKSKGEIK